MKYFIICLSLIATLSHAEMVTRELYCGETQVITATLKETYNEAPVLIGKADDVASSLMSLWINVSLGTWTLISTKDSVTCVVGTGTNLMILKKKDTKTL